MQECLPSRDQPGSRLSLTPALPSRLQLAENFNGADLRNICTEAGMFAIRDERDYTVHEDFMKVGWMAPVRSTMPGRWRIERILVDGTDGCHVPKCCKEPCPHDVVWHFSPAGCAQAGGGQEAGEHAVLRLKLWGWQILISSSLDGPMAVDGVAMHEAGACHCQEAEGLGLPSMCMVCEEA